MPTDHHGAEAPQDGDVWVYDAPNNQWILVTGGAGASMFVDLNDVDIPVPPDDGDVVVFDAIAGKFINAPPGGGSGADVQSVTSPSRIANVDQVPDYYISASETRTIDWVTISGASPAAGITATLKKNGTDMFASSTKPAVPGGGGISAERTPDTGSFHLAAGDKLTLNLTGGTAGPIVVTIGFTPD